MSDEAPLVNVRSQGARDRLRHAPDTAAVSSVAGVLLTVILTVVLAVLTGTAAGARAARRQIRRVARRQTAQHNAPAERLEQPSVRVGPGDPDRSDRPVAPDRPASAASASVAPPLVPTRMRRANANDGSRPAGKAVAALSVPSRPGRIPLKPTAIMAVPASELDRVVLRVSRAVGESVHPLPNEEGLTIDPKAGDVVVPELSVGLILGRNGDVWTVQSAGPVDPAVTLDGVPLTSVAIPWTSSRRLTAGALTLSLENAPSELPSFEEPAMCTSAKVFGTWAARANAYGLAIGASDGQDASTLVTSALAAFDPRMLDPARAAALAALNITLTVRDTRRERPDGVSEEEAPRVAVLGVDERGELRGAANFDVSVWGLTEEGCVMLSRHVMRETSPLEVVPLDIALPETIGRRPLLLLTAGAPAASFADLLGGATTRTVSSDQLVRAVAGPARAPGRAAAAAVWSRERLSRLSVADLLR
jgi:hypothetical protein